MSDREAPREPLNFTTTNPLLPDRLFLRKTLLRPAQVGPFASVALLAFRPEMLRAPHGAYSESLEESLEKAPRKRPLSTRHRNAISCAGFAALPVESAAHARG